jgi:DNA-binding MarR family transcriptional regulator
MGGVVMTVIKMVRFVKGEDKIKELKEKYGSIENLKRILDSSEGDMLNELDLENWEHYSSNPEELLQEGKTVFVENLKLSSLDFELMHQIKNNSPASIKELASLLNKEVSTVQKKAKCLEKEGLIQFKLGSKNRRIPILNYDKLEIPI